MCCWTWIGPLVDGRCDGLFQPRFLSDISIWYSGSKGHLEDLPTVPRPSEAINIVQPFHFSKVVYKRRGHTRPIAKFLFAISQSLWLWGCLGLSEPTMRWQRTKQKALIYDPKFPFQKPHHQSLWESVSTRWTAFQPQYWVSGLLSRATPFNAPCREKKTQKANSGTGSG